METSPRSLLQRSIESSTSLSGCSVSTGQSGSSPTPFQGNANWRRRIQPEGSCKAQSGVRRTMNFRLHWTGGRHSLNRLLIGPLVYFFFVTPAPVAGQTPVDLSPETPVAGHLGVRWRVEGPLDLTSGKAAHPPVVTGVVACSPAHRAGLQPGDRILSVDGRDARQAPVFPVARPGTVYRLTVERDGQRRGVVIRVARRGERTWPLIEEAPIDPPKAWECPAG